MAAPQRRRLYLVEDHPVTREGLARLINFERDLHVCGQAGSSAQALAEIARDKPQLVLVDISLAGASGIELIKDIVARHPGLLVLVLSTHDETLYAERALRAGAKGYIMKHESTDEVMKAIRKVLSGGVYLSERMQGQLVAMVAGGGPTASGSNVERLSDRELEVFTLFGQGQSTAQISASLHISESTVATHRTHIMEKLRLENSRELLQRAVEWVQSQNL
ncbi:MAG: response regulator transcription factor [Verrucomicrobiota bacterium]